MSNAESQSKAIDENQIDGLLISELSIYAFG